MDTTNRDAAIRSVDSLLPTLGADGLLVGSLVVSAATAIDLALAGGPGKAYTLPPLFRAYESALDRLFEAFERATFRRDARADDDALAELLAGPDAGQF